LTILEQGKTVVYKAGDYYYESGDVTHSADNKSNSPVLVLQFEILPAGTLIPPKPR
jgi:quercetin dioxygenase-like cupin family protein